MANPIRFLLPTGSTEILVLAIPTNCNVITGGFFLSSSVYTGQHGPALALVAALFFSGDNTMNDGLWRMAVTVYDRWKC